MLWNIYLNNLTKSLCIISINNHAVTSSALWNNGRTTYATTVVAISAL
jgi:hypothetical protein